MNKLEKIRRLIQEGKQHSILYQLQNKQRANRQTVQKIIPQTQKQKQNNFSIISVLNFESNLQNSSFGLKNQEKNAVDNNPSENGLILKLKKVQNYTCSMTTRQQRHVFQDTVENVSSLIAKHVVRDVRINKADLNTKTIKNIKTRDSQDKQTHSQQSDKKNIKIFVAQRPKTMRRSPKKIAYRTISREKRFLSPIRHTSPTKGIKLSGWQVNQQPQYEWQ